MFELTREVRFAILPDPPEMLTAGVPAAGVPAAGVPAAGVPAAGAAVTDNPDSSSSSFILHPSSFPPVPTTGTSATVDTPTQLPVAKLLAAGVPTAGLPATRGEPVQSTFAKLPAAGLPTAGLPTASPAGAKINNSFAGYPPITEIVPYLNLRITISGDLDSHTHYMRNIRDIDRTVRQVAIPLVGRHIHSPHRTSDLTLPAQIFDKLKDAWPPATLKGVELVLSPYFTVGCNAEELPMIRLSERFEFSAGHRLHNPQFTHEQNIASYGKCNNPHGHGHNYIVQVTLTGRPDIDGQLLPIAEFEQIVAAHVIEPFDHKNLNEQVPEFATLIPTVENIARVIYQRLKPHLARQSTRLASITVWETPKTWCEYSE